VVVGREKFCGLVVLVSGPTVLAVVGDVTIAGGGGDGCCCAGEKRSSKIVAI